MNREYIDYIDYLIDIAQRNDVFYLTSREFNEFSSEVLEVLEKQMPRKPITERTRYGMLYDCSVCECGLEPHNNYCPQCGQAIDWSEE